jgi:hypothetical protein
LKIVIYDPPMCCSSGVCGPSVDNALIKINDAILALKKQGVEVERYDLRRNYTTFLENDHVREILQKQGVKQLPITIIREKVFKTSEYPRYEEICEALGIEPLQKAKPITLNIE